SYGYVNYFSAYGLYPEVMERHFALQADYWLLNNRAAARAYREGHLPPAYRLDHDMADSRGTLVNIKSLDQIWFSHFARCIKPLTDIGVKLIWHTDGNMMQMVPRLLEVGIKGFQGFQYECGIDYEQMSAMKTRDGDDLILFAGLSATDGVLRDGTPDDVKRYLQWIVDKGPRTGLFLSSMGIYPDMPWENVRTYVEGIQYYRKHGRG
ncbi:MAG: uroporphyrinogen decarboxylase family protein, partial [Armatimonadota bacterium]